MTVAPEIKEEVRQVFIELALITRDEQWFLELTKTETEKEKERDRAATLFILSHLEKQLRHHYNLFTLTRHAKLKRKHRKNVEQIKYMIVEECLLAMAEVTNES